MKNLYHIAEDVSKASGGIRTVIKELFKNQQHSQVLTNRKDNTDINFRSFNSRGPWLYSISLREFLKSRDKDSIFHIHGVWMYAQFIASRVAIKHGIPFILSPHGMYESWLWKDGTIKKKIYFRLFVRSAFAKASYIHAITPDEQFNLKKLFPTTRIVCIPNAIETQELIKETHVEKPYFLFLGRIHPKKGLDLLIDSFNALTTSKYELKIAGPENDYSRKIQESLKSKGIKNIRFLGAVSGEDKKQLYRNAHIFIAPSYSEVVGMVNLEAAMMATPVITTHQTGLLKGWNTNGGILINPSPTELSDALKKAHNWTKEERDTYGLKLRDFVITNYSWDIIKPKWNQLYEQLQKK